MSTETEALSRRELLAVAGVASGKTATAALLEAGYSRSVAESQQKAVLGKPRVQRAILAAMEKAGITEELLARTLKQGLVARKGVYHEGRRIAHEADHTNRHRFAKTALQLRGDLGRDVEDQGDTWESLILAVKMRRAQTPTIEE